MIENESALIPFNDVDLPTGPTLIFSPHPDDETFGMGGSIIKLKNNKQIIHVVIMTDGALGGDPEKRKLEFYSAAKLLGIDSYLFFNAEDRKLNVTSQNIERIAKIISELNPTNIYFPSPSEYHPDHRATAWLVWNTLQLIQFSGNCFSYEVGNQGQANTLVDITNVMNDKVNTMKAYTSQLDENDYIEKIKAMNRARSYTLREDVKYAEAFYRFDDITLDLVTNFTKNQNKAYSGFECQHLPLVSVLIRTKNRPEHLESALISLKNQTYTKFEINIVNDGGCDIENVINKLNFENIYIKNNKQSKGRSAAANSLLTMAQGDYCIFLDDDDTFDNNHLEKLVTPIAKNKNMLVCYSGVRVGNGLENSHVYNQAYNAALLRRGNYIPIHAVLFSKKLIELGCRFDESFEIYEDWDFWLQVSRHTNFHHVNGISATYNINGDSGAGQSNKNMDQRAWLLKVYDKWSKSWTPIEVMENFSINTPLPTHKLQANLEEKNRRIKELENKIKDNKIINTHLSNHIDLVLAERLNASEKFVDLDSEGNGFTLKSTRLYQAQCRELYEKVFGKTISKEFWDWKYNGVKWRGVCAIKNDKVIAHYNGMQRDILFFGEYKKALGVSDIMISPDERGGFKKNSPFYNMTITWGSSNIVASKSFALFYGFPNKRHASLGQKLGLYVEVDTVSEFNWNITENNQAISNYDTKEYVSNSNDDEKVNTTWRAMSLDFKNNIIGFRNINYIKNRYLKHPEIQYKVYTIYDKEELIALFVLKAEGKNMLLMDVVAKAENFHIVINEAIQLTKKVNCLQLKCWITKSQSHLFNCHNGVENDIGVSIPHANYGDIEKATNKWFLMYGDTDFI